MGWPQIRCLALFIALLQLPGATPPWTPGPSGGQRGPTMSPSRFPVDDPRQTQQSPKPKIDAALAKRQAQELAKLAQEIPSSVEQADKGVLPKDLNDRLKRIEKLSKQLRRDLYL